MKFKFVAAVLAAALLAGHAQAQTKVKIGVVKLTGSIPIYLAVDKGYFKEQGLDPELVYFDASAPLATAVVSGDTDFGSAGISGALFNLGAKGGLTMIASQLKDEPGFHLNAVMATKAAYDKGFKSVTDLPGKRFGTTTVGATPQYIVNLLAKKYHFDAEKVTMVPLQTQQNLNAAFAGSQVDGGVIGAAAAIQFEKDGVGKILAWSGDETAWQVGVQVTRPAEIRDHKDVVQKWVNAYVKGIRAYTDAVKYSADGKLTKGPGYDEVVAITAKYLALKPEQVEGIFPAFPADGDVDLADVKNQVAFYQSLGLVDKTADVDKMTDLSFAHAAAKK